MFLSLYTLRNELIGIRTYFLDWSASLAPSHDPSVLLNVKYGRFGIVQIEEMYSVPESFLEIEVRNPQTHGE